jgi:hypothetical protein
MPKTREFQTLLYACTQEGCLICRLVQDSLYRYLDGWKYENFTDVRVRQELRRTQGFCHTHTWQLARMGATLPLAQAYRDIISDTVEQLQQGGETGGTGGLWRRLFESKRGRDPDEACPACKQGAQAAERYGHTFRQAILDDEFYQQFGRSDGLCLDHFRVVCQNKGPEVPGPWLSRLRQAQMVCLQRLDEQLGELIRKHDYRFKNEPRGSEMHSWKRAAGLVAGENERT